MQVLKSTSFLYWLSRAFLVLTLFSSAAFGANWKYFYCNNSENSDSIELELSADQKASLKTKESVYLLLQTPCQGISSQGPFLKCYDNFGSDSRVLYSFSRIESGFIDGYSAELFNEKVFHIIFERSYQDAKGQYQQIKREFKFMSKDCVWE